MITLTITGAINETHQFATNHQAIAFSKAFLKRKEALIQERLDQLNITRHSKQATTIIEALSTKLTFKETSEALPKPAPAPKKSPLQIILSKAKNFVSKDYLRPALQQIQAIQGIIYASCGHILFRQETTHTTLNQAWDKKGSTTPAERYPEAEDLFQAHIAGSTEPQLLEAQNILSQIPSLKAIAPSSHQAYILPEGYIYVENLEFDNKSYSKLDFKTDTLFSISLRSLEKALKAFDKKDTITIQHNHTKRSSILSNGQISILIMHTKMHNYFDNHTNDTPEQRAYKTIGIPQPTPIQEPIQENTLEVHIEPTPAPIQEHTPAPKKSPYFYTTSTPAPSFTNPPSFSHPKIISKQKPIPKNHSNSPESLGVNPPKTYLETVLKASLKPFSSPFQYPLSERYLCIIAIPKYSIIAISPCTHPTPQTYPVYTSSSTSPHSNGKSSMATTPTSLKPTSKWTNIWNTPLKYPNTS